MSFALTIITERIDLPEMNHSACLTSEIVAIHNGVLDEPIFVDV